MLHWYNQSWREVQDMPLEKGWELIGNISRIHGMFHGESDGVSSSGGQLKPGEMGSPAQIAAMSKRIQAEQGDPFDPNKHIMKDGVRYNIRRKR